MGGGACRNNAGFMSGKFELAADGLEKVFATNQIGQCSEDAFVL